MNLIKYLVSRKYRERRVFDLAIKKKYPKTNIKPKNTLCMSLISLGDYSYGEPKIDTLGSENESLKVGHFVSIADNVTFILSGGHFLNTFSTFPFKSICLAEQKTEAQCKGPIIVGDDVWIGYGVTILSGVIIGQGAVIAAGAVVSSSLEPYGIYGGVPAKLIRYRFDKEIRDELQKINFSLFNIEKIKKLKQLLYSPLNTNILNEIKNEIGA